jgi:hypothetical protein
VHCGDPYADGRACSGRDDPGGACEPAGYPVKLWFCYEAFTGQVRAESRWARERPQTYLLHSYSPRLSLRVIDLADGHTTRAAAIGDFIATKAHMAERFDAKAAEMRGHAAQARALLDEERSDGA